ncbi:MAG TPA: cytochrome b N-terminal domain-containing protein [Candidatus Saccharimonadales bacterium]|nr:cytochrome b N-terminal domain-containing protein [Candidatus Saccharimonadales bacterium]
MSTQLPLIKALRQTMIQDVPAYANKLFYSLGFLSMTSFMVLIATGVVMAIYGPDWWLTSTVGHYFRSIHLWATQAFVLFVILHLLIVFFSSGFKKPRRLTWVLGALMFLFVMAEAEFGYVLRDDFSSQWRSLQGADLYNGTGLGWWLHNINYRQIYGIHIVVVPAVLLGLLFMHYLLVRVLGIAKPYRKEVHVPTVKANHTVLFARGGVLVGLILLLAVVFPSPFLRPDTIQEVAQQDPALMGQTLMQEYTRSSDTSTYVDNIAPYTFNTRQVYVAQPYAQLVAAEHTPNLLQQYGAEPAAQQSNQLKEAQTYFDKTYPGDLNGSNPLEQVVSSLVDMASAGLYQPTLNSADPSGDQTSYALRFLADTGVLDTRAQSLNITTDQYGMLHEESGHAPGAWWLAPIGLLDHTLLANDSNGDRDGAIIVGGFFLLLIALPYIPGLNRLPEVFRLNKFIWRV